MQHYQALYDQCSSAASVDYIENKMAAPVDNVSESLACCELQLLFHLSTMYANIIDKFRRCNVYSETIFYT